MQQLEYDQATDNMYNDPTGQMALQGLDPNFNDMGGGEVPPDFSNGTTPPPNDMPIYTDMTRDVRGKPPNPNQDWNTGDGYE